jgi:hypothetical protein
MSETKLFGGNPTAHLLEQGCRVGHAGVLIRLQISEGVDSAQMPTWARAASSMSARPHTANTREPEVVPGLVELEVAVPRLRPAEW